MAKAVDFVNGEKPVLSDYDIEVEPNLSDEGSSAVRDEVNGLPCSRLRGCDTSVVARGRGRSYATVVLVNG